MQLYKLLLITSFLFSFFEIQKNIKKNFKYSFLQKIYIFILWLLIAFNRGNADYISYKNYFYLSNTYGEITSVEKGYILLNIFVKKIGGNFDWILFITGSFFIYVLFKKYKIKYPVCFFLLYVSYNFLYDLPQTRNMLAISLFLFGFYKYILEDKNIGKIYSFIGLFFHKIIVVYFLYYFLKIFNYKKYILLCFGITIITFCLKDYFLEVAKIIFTTERVENYLVLPNKGILQFGFYFSQILFDFLVIYIGNYKKNINKKEEDILKFIFFPLLFATTCFINTELIIRLLRGTFFIKCYYFFNILLKKHNKVNRNLLWIIILMGNFIFYLSNFRASKYNFILNLIDQIDNIKILL